MVSNKYVTPKTGAMATVEASLFVKDESTFFSCGLLDAFREPFLQSVELVKQMDFESDTIFQYLVQHKRLNPKRLDEFVQADVLSHWLMYELASFELKMSPADLPTPSQTLLSGQAAAKAPSSLKRSKRAASKPAVLRKSKRIKAVRARRRKRASPSTKSKTSLSKSKAAKKLKQKVVAKKAKKTNTKKVKKIKINTAMKTVDNSKSKNPVKAKKPSIKETPKAEAKEGRILKAKDGFGGCTGYIKSIPQNHDEETQVVMEQRACDLEENPKSPAIKPKRSPQVIPIDRASHHTLEKWQLDSDRDLTREKFDKMQASLLGKIKELEAMEARWRSVVENKHKEEVARLGKKIKIQETRVKELEISSETQKKLVQELKELIGKKDKENCDLEALLAKEKKEKTYWSTSQGSHSAAIMTNWIPGEVQKKDCQRIQEVESLASPDKGSGDNNSQKNRSERQKKDNQKKALTKALDSRSMMASEKTIKGLTGGKKFELGLSWTQKQEPKAKSFGTQTSLKLNIMTREKLKTKLTERALLVEKARGKELQKLAEAQKKQIHRLKTQIHGNKKENRTRSKSTQTPSLVATRHSRGVKMLPRKVNVRWCGRKSTSTTTSPDEPQRNRPPGWRIPQKPKRILDGTRLKRKRVTEQGDEADNEKLNQYARPSKKKCSNLKRAVPQCLNRGSFSPNKRVPPIRSTWINPKFALANSDDSANKSSRKEGTGCRQVSSDLRDSASVEVRRLKRLGDTGGCGPNHQDFRDQSRRVSNERADQPRSSDSPRKKGVRFRNSISPRLAKKRRIEAEYREGGEGRRERQIMKWSKTKRPERRRNLKYNLEVLDDDSIEEGECPFYANSEPGFRSDRSISRIDKWHSEGQRQEASTRGFKRDSSNYSSPQCNDRYLGRRYSRSRRDSDESYCCWCDDIRCHSRCTCCDNSSKIMS